MKKILLISLLCLVAACSPESRTAFGGIGSSLLSSAGLPVSSSSVSTLIDAGDKISKAARGLTDEQEYYLGRGVAAVILSKYQPVKNDALTRYVNKVGRAVAVFSDRPETFGGYHFVVLDTNEINAVSAPGGFVFITRGFLKVIPNEDALAAVLAHEVGHIVKGHGTAAISNANLTSAVTELGKQAAVERGGAITSQIASTFGDSITDITNTILEKGYSRSQEYEADEYAAELLGKAGYNQMAMVQMLDSLKALEASNPSGGWFSTHPAPERRESNVKDEVKLTDSAATPDGAAGERIRTNRFKAATKGV